MKNVILTAAFIAAALLSMASCATQRLSPEEQSRRETFVRESIQERDYTIYASRAMPQSGRAINLTTNYSLAVKGDTVQAYLPYYGRAYSLPYGGGEGLRFEAPISGYTVRDGKNGSQSISFTARSREDSYDINIDIFPNGTSYFTVSPNNKQSISFDGQLRQNMQATY